MWVCLLWWCPFWAGLRGTARKPLANSQGPLFRDNPMFGVCRQNGLPEKFKVHELRKRSFESYTLLWATLPKLALTFGLSSRRMFQGSGGTTFERSTHSGAKDERHPLPSFGAKHGPNKKVKLVGISPHQGCPLCSK